MAASPSHGVYFPLMSNEPTPLAALNVRSITYPAKFQPVEQTAALELARLTGAKVGKSARPGRTVVSMR